MANLRTYRKIKEYFNQLGTDEKVTHYRIMLQCGGEYYGIKEVLEELIKEGKIGFMKEQYRTLYYKT